MSRPRISVVLVLLATAAMVLPALASATQPQRGARYAGTVTVQHFSQGDVEFPLSFVVDPSGRELASFSFPKGAPFGTRCQQGPLGEPATAGRHATVERGGIDVTFPLEFLFEGAEKSGQPDLGTVHLEGSFRPHGAFVGTLDNRTPVKACRGSWTFKLRVGSN